MHGSTLRRLGWLALATLSAGAQAQAPNLLRVELEAAGSFDRSHEWSIVKRVTPASADRFIGETQALAYTLELTRGDAQDAGFGVTGHAVIANDTAFEANVTAITLTWGGLPVAHACATGPLAPGASRRCEVAFAASSGEPQALELAVDTRGDVSGARVTEAVRFVATAVTGETVTVRDTQLAAPLTFAGSGTYEYTVDAKCVDGNTVVVDNTATIVETGAAASATARIACHATRMERSVASFGGKQWDWVLSKTHAAALPLQVVAGQSYDVDYTITATATATVSGVVHGAITAINTHPSVDAVIRSVQARINASDAVVTCPATMIAPHATYDADRNIVVGRLTCPFTVTLAAGETPATVTGRVEHQLFDYDSAGNATAGDIRLLQGTQPVSSLPPGDSRDECIALADLYLGRSHDLGGFCAGDAGATVTRRFSGPIGVTADDDCELAVANLARLTTNDSDTRVEASSSVTVERTDCVAAAPAGALQLDISGSGTFTRRFPWTIDKTVTPASSDRFIGETQSLAYTLTLTKGAAEDAGFRITGAATLVNDGATVADIAAIEILHGEVPVPHACAATPLPAGESRTCPLDFQTATAEPRLLAMRVTTRGDVAGGEASATVAFGAPALSGDSITVDDTLLPDDLSFSQSGTHEYTYDATCRDGSTVVVDNTATIVETGASDAVRARVACHAIRMERSVTGAGSRSYAWNIEKTHGLAAPLMLARDESQEVSYSITATATAIVAGGEAGTVQGSIVVINPHPVVDAVILSVQAWINDTPATVSCPTPLRSPASTHDGRGDIQSGRLVCPFSVTLAAGEVPATVRGRVEQQLFHYDGENRPTAAGTHVLQGTQPVATPSGGAVGDRCARLTDVYLGTVHDLGEFCASPEALSVTRPFTARIAVVEEAGCRFSVPNTARLVASDSGATSESTVEVAVERTDCDAVEPLAAAVGSPPGPVVIPSASTVSLALLALLLGLGGVGMLSRRER
jgi:hypothetical protein